MEGLTHEELESQVERRESGLETVFEQVVAENLLKDTAPPFEERVIAK